MRGNVSMAPATARTLQVTLRRMRKLPLLTLSLALVMTRAQAQPAQPNPYDMPAYQPPGQMQAPSLSVPDQSFQRYVPQHIGRDGTYVPPHYEARRPAPFKGHFADKEAQRQRGRQRGYKEPLPNYYNQQPDDAGKRMEGR